MNLYNFSFGYNFIARNYNNLFFFLHKKNFIKQTFMIMYCESETKMKEKKNDHNDDDKPKKRINFFWSSRNGLVIYVCCCYCFGSCILSK